MTNPVRKSDIVFNETHRLNKRNVEMYVPLSNLKILALAHLAFRRDKQVGFSNTEQDRECKCNVTLRCVPPTIIVVESSKYYTFRECVFVALGIQHAMRMRYIIIYGFSRSTTFLHIIS